MSLGLGAMIQMMGAIGGDQDSAEVLQKAIGNTITNIELDDEANDGDGALKIWFGPEKGIQFFDTARSCCESRYLTTDDDLGSFRDTIFKGAELRDMGGPAINEPDQEEDAYGDEQEEQCLIVQTNVGEFTVVSHNNHNGYYGGICIRVSPLEG